MDVLLSCGSCVCPVWAKGRSSGCLPVTLAACVSWVSKPEPALICCCCQDVFRLLFYILTEPQESELIYTYVVAAPILYCTCTLMCTM